MRRLKVVFGWALTTIAVVLGIAIAVLASWLFGVERYDPSTDRSFDGLGRELTWNIPGPFGPEQSPGLLWEVVYGAAGIAAFGVCAGIFAIGRRLRQAGQVGSARRSPRAPE
jgi:uncharacterized membrane protein YraQ (UPF0718 family)